MSNVTSLTQNSKKRTWIQEGLQPAKKMSEYSWILLFGSVLWSDVPWLSNKFSCEEKRFSQTRVDQNTRVQPVRPQKNPDLDGNPWKRPASMRFKKPLMSDSFNQHHGRSWKSATFTKWCKPMRAIQNESLIDIWMKPFMIMRNGNFPCWITSYHFYSFSSLVQRLQKDPGIIFSTNNQAWPTFTPNLQIINQRLKRFEDLLILSRLQDLDLQQLRLTEPTAELWNRKSPSWGKVHQKVSQGYNRPAERSLCFRTHG